MVVSPMTQLINNDVQNGHTNGHLTNGLAPHPSTLAAFDGPVEVVPGVWRGRWGYYPGNYADYLVLKRLFAYYQVAWNRFKAWTRWKRKSPRNRRVWAPIEQRLPPYHIVAWRNVGTQLEPKLVAPLTGRFPVEGSFQFHKKRGEATECFIYGVGPDCILADYRSLRYPAESAAKVQPLQGNMEHYRRLLAQCEQWANQNS